MMSSELPPLYKIIKVPKEFEWSELYQRIADGRADHNDWQWIGNFLYTVAYHAVWNYGLCKTENEKMGLSYDITQDKLETICKDRKNLKLRDENGLGGYLYTMIINRVRDKYRERSRGYRPRMKPGECQHPKMKHQFDYGRCPDCGYNYRFANRGTDSVQGGNVEDILNRVEDPKAMKDFEEVEERDLYDCVAYLIKTNRTCSELSRKVLLESLKPGMTDKKIARLYNKSEVRIRRVKWHNRHKFRHDQDFIKKSGLTPRKRRIHPGEVI